jgi:hypothetical protein
MTADLFLSGGIFEDDGNPINSPSIPMPGLWVLCKLDDDSDPEENLLCSLNRFDQRNEKEFKCGTFESKAVALYRSMKNF